MLKSKCVLLIDLKNVSYHFSGTFWWKALTKNILCKFDRFNDSFLVNATIGLSLKIPLFNNFCHDSQLGFVFIWWTLKGGLGLSLTSPSKETHEHLAYLQLKSWLSYTDYMYALITGHNHTQALFFGSAIARCLSMTPHTMNRASR